MSHYAALFLVVDLLSQHYIYRPQRSISAVIPSHHEYSREKMHDRFLPVSQMDIARDEELS